MKTITIIPQNETKAEKFVRIATPRVNSVIDKLDILANCAGVAYEYNEEQIDSMFGAIRNAVDACYLQFQPKQKSEKERFTF